MKLKIGDEDGTINKSSEVIANGTGAANSAFLRLLFLPGFVGASYSAPAAGGIRKLRTVVMLPFTRSSLLLIPIKLRLNLSA